MSSEGYKKFAGAKLGGVSPENGDSPVSGFEIQATLGEGQTVKVLKARQTSLDRIVVLKVLDPTLCDEDEAKQFLQDAQKAAKLQHPNLVTVYDAGINPGNEMHFVVTEFVEGSSLEQVLEEEGKLEEPDAVAVCQAVAEALTCAEEHDLFHGNLKPANILIDEDMTPRVSDLNLSAPIGQATPAVLVQSGGAPHYIAPEQALGLPTDIRSDLYALGITLFRLLTGKFPFTGRTARELADQHVNEDVPDPRDFEPQLSEGLAKVIGWLCARDPNQRYPTATSAGLDLVRLMAGREPMGPTGPAMLSGGSDTESFSADLVPKMAMDLGDYDDSTPQAWTGDVPYKVRLSSRGVTLAEYDFDQDVVTIGRSKDAGIHIDNPIVSRRHAQIRREGIKFSIVPLSSTNATALNGERLYDPSALTLGDLVVLSDKFHVHIEWDPRAAKRPPQPAESVDPDDDPDSETTVWAKKEPPPDPPTAQWKDKPPELKAAEERYVASPYMDDPYGARDDELGDDDVTPSGGFHTPRDLVPDSKTPPPSDSEAVKTPATIPVGAISPDSPTRPYDADPQTVPAVGPPSSKWNAPRGYLLFVRGGADVRSFVDKGFQIGSSHACDLRLGRDAPRKAALVVRCSDGYRLFNVAPSFDAVTLNGEPVPDQAVLEHGDEIRVCGVSLSFQSKA